MSYKKVKRDMSSNKLLALPNESIEWHHSLKNYKKTP